MFWGTEEYVLVIHQSEIFNFEPSQMGTIINCDTTNQNTSQSQFVILSRVVIKSICVKFSPSGKGPMTFQTCSMYL